MSFAAYDDVIVNRDAERLGCLHDHLRHIDICTRGRGIARRMVVHQDESRRGQLQRTLDHLSYIDWRVIDGAAPLYLVRDEVVFLVQKESAELLDGIVTLRDA